ncbi:hypothetical protein L210DRAFT_2834958 [Boletus edulis BED1]|uniref:Uncharacterized protein n=1 Tax=Boletus edulis BED1 TaxID=1328754 RepID=A0AAD4GJ70_BOLED|nr:hypothetical protein L210DRAFT_2834958 [Boletus edulis BED1]
MSSIFTPSQAIDMSKEKDWPMHLGMLDWDNTKVVFTKRSLVEFLKYTGITIDPGFTNIQKLPRYAQFGNMVASSDSEETTDQETTSSTPAAQPPARTGVQNLFEEQAIDDALATAPPPPSAHQPDDAPASSGFRPTRRVRTIPGGADSIGHIFAKDEPTEQFIPTRRVRQRPGGTDSIEGLF